jgi:hypothetical protein
MSTGAARIVAILYTALLMGAGLILLAGTLSDPDVSWRRVAGHSLLALVAPLPPLLTLWLGRRFAVSPRADWILGTGILVMVACPLILLLMAASSAEPLAMLTLLYAPPLQVLIGAITIGLAAWARRREASQDQAGERE